MRWMAGVVDAMAGDGQTRAEKGVLEWRPHGRYLFGEVHRLYDVASDGREWSGCRVVIREGGG